MSRKRKHEDEENDDPNISESSGEDLFGSNYREDYASHELLDEYDPNDDFFAPTLEEDTPTQDIPFENDIYEDSVPINVEVSSSLKTTLSSFLKKNLTKQIKNMCTSNQESLYVSYLLLEKEHPDLLSSLIKDTEEFMKTFDSSLSEIVIQLFPNYKYIKPVVHVRVIDVPVLEHIRSLRNIHLGTLIKVRGVVTRRSSIIPMLNIVTYICFRCGNQYGPVPFDMGISNACIMCQSKGPHSILSSETLYKDLQKVVIQEVPGTVPSGRLPRQKEVHLTCDLIDICKPGEEIEVTGIYKNTFTYNNILNKKGGGFPTFSTIVQAISIEKKEDQVSLSTDVKQIIKLSKNPQIVDILVNSFAPSIYGHRNVKKSLLLALFGGQRKEKEGHVIRGDINVLLLGDPGTAKSQFLRYIEKISHRGVLASGQGSSSVGLTASVRRDPMTKEWALEGGALVLADRGVCLIDEFDKMDDIDRVSIHEAMEQQSISISKAGIVASLHARCSVIAAANPRKGRYNNNLTFSQNVNLSDPIVSRFDILCVIRDNIGSEDEIMGNFIIESHKKIQEDDNKDEEYKNKNSNEKILDQDTLRKYIIYARNNCNPKLKEIDREKISRMYSDLRKESMISGSIPITARHIEGIIRMAESFARMKLRETVSKEDIDNAIEIALESFINSQKYAVNKILRKKFNKYINTGIEALMYVLDQMINEKYITHCKQINIPTKEFENRISGIGLTFRKDFYTSEDFKKCGYTLENGKIVKRNDVI